MKSKIYFYLPCLFVGMILSSYHLVNAQTTTINSALKIVAPSPTAAGLGNFGKVPVSYYTGTASVTVPLYSIKTTSNELDIDLQYSSSGFKPGDDASWAGLGWSLNAGGVITRAVRGNPDLRNGNKGYYCQVPLPPNNIYNNYNVYSSTQSADITSFKEMLRGWEDGEPDVYYYSFPGYSGKFVMGKPAPTSGTKYEVSRTNLDIIYDESVFAHEGWIITDGNGYKYYFYASEFTDQYMNSSNIAITNNAAFESSMSIDPINASTVSSWYLNKIEAPSGETITFDYTVQGASTANSPIAYYEEDNTMLNWGVVTPSCSTVLQGRYYNYQVTREKHFPLYLNKITFKTGYILINANESDIYRTDVDYQGTAPQKFKKLEVYDNANNLIKKVVMNYGYFGTAGSTINSRLRLDQVTEYASDGVTAKPAHVFTYFNATGTFPDKNTKALDWWNYYNGMYNNTTLISRVKAGTTTYNGGVRLASTNADDPTVAFLKNGILTSVIYPTGGQTVFDYERNEYGNTSDLDGFGTISKNAGGVRIKSVTNYDPDNVATLKRYFYTNEGYTTGTTTSSGLLVNPPSFVAFKAGTDTHVEIYEMASGVSIAYNCYIDARYLMRTSASNSIDGFSSNGAIVGYSKVTEVTGPNLEGGIIEYYYKNTADVLNDIPGIPNFSAPDNGQLTKEIYRDFLLQPVKQITYQYDSADSSSLKGLKVINFDRSTTPNSYSFMPKYYDNKSKWWKLTSKTETNYYGTDASSVTTNYFYDNVLHKELTREETAQSDGSILINKYKRVQDYAGYTANTVFNTMNTKHMISLPIEEQTLYSRGGTSKLVDGNLNQYKLISTYSGTNNHVVADVDYELHTANPTSDLTESYLSGATLNKHSSYEAVLQYGLYDDKGNLREYHKPNDISTSYLWDYDNKSLPVAEITNAQPDKVYCESFENNVSGVVSALAKTGKKVLNSGSYSFPGSFVAASGSLMSYWYYNGSVWVFSGIVPYTSSISSGGQLLDEIRAYPSGAFVKTYTYNPLIGISSETDVNNIIKYYSYDSFGRLKLIKDVDGNIVKQYDYHYKQ